VSRESLLDYFTSFPTVGKFESGSESDIFVGRGVTDSILR